MTSSLVGSEMCIRDRCNDAHQVLPTPGTSELPRIQGTEATMARCCKAVSYTHLTLPTICSV
eukprot:2686136-Prorocentrum_lima.AAC.1